MVATQEEAAKLHPGQVDGEGRWRVDIVERDTAITVQPHADVYVQGYERCQASRVATVYPWYHELEERNLGHDLRGFAWMIMPIGPRWGIPRTHVPISDCAPTFEAACEWCRWYIEEGPRQLQT